MTPVADMNSADIVAELVALRAEVMPYRLAKRLRIAVGEARILATLLAANGELVGRWPMVDPIGTVGGDRVVDVYLCRLRKALPRGSIKTVQGKGWRLTHVGLAAVAP